MLGLLVSVGFATPARAVSEATFSTGLSQSQVIAIINLLSSFGADASVITSVTAALQGQATGGTTPAEDSMWCVTLMRDLIIGSTDQTTNGEVSRLQKFLAISPALDHGNVAYPEGKITGYYGQLTAQAVMKWQKANGMDYVNLTSGVGPATRAKMTCTGAATGPAISSVVWRIESANPAITDDGDYRKYEQVIFVDVIRTDNSIRSYTAGKAYGCTGSTVQSTQDDKKTLGQVTCYYALVGTNFVAYTQNGRFFVERQNESARDGSVTKTIVVEI